MSTTGASARSSAPCCLSSAEIGVRLYRSRIGELYASVGIDIQAARTAPVDECARIDVGANSTLTVPARLAFGLLGLEAPEGVRPGQPVTIHHDGLDLFEVLEAIPDQADDLRLLLKGVHGRTP